MRGILSHAGYLPYRRLQRAAIAELLGGTPAKGTRTVASFDEDTTSMAVEAGRLALRALDPAAGVDAVWFSTAEPPYLDKTNATTVHAALRLDTECAALDACGSVRSGTGALRAALDGRGTLLVTVAGLRTGLATSADEAGGGDGAAALVVGDGDAGTVLAEYLGAGSATEEFVDRWRVPGERSSKRWEERFAETRYLPLGERAWQAALKATGLTAEQVDVAVVTGSHERAAKALGGRLGVARVAPDLTDSVGNTGAAHAALVLSSVLETAEPGQVVALVNLADGADVLVFRTTDAVTARRPVRPLAEQVAGGADLPYGKFLSWRGMLDVEPPNRPLPARPSAPAAARSEDWKYAFVGSRDRSSGLVHLPPSRASARGATLDEMDPAPMADVPATVTTFTVDRLAYSPSPPIVFAVLDFDGGGRFACELTDVDAGDVAVGDRVEMTFRRLFTADGLHNYFWKARPVRGEGS